MTFENDIVADLTSIENDIYDAVLLDEFSLKGLVARLADLNSRVMSSQALAKGLLGPRTVSLMHSISSKARVVANNMLSIHRTTEDIAERRSAQIADVLSRVTLEDGGEEPGVQRASKSSLQQKRRPRKATSPDEMRTPKQTPLVRSSSCSTISSTCASSSATAVEDASEDEEEDFVPKAVDWLLKHLHNPYPSNVTKADIAGSSSSRQKCVGDWFTNVRRRMGWSSILKKHFNGDRVAAIDCAHRIFSEEAKRDTVPAEVLTDFVEMKQRLNEMFEGKLKASELAENIDTIHVVSKPKVSLKSKPNLKKRRASDSKSDSDSDLNFESNHTTTHKSHLTKSNSQQRASSGDRKVEDQERPQKRKRPESSEAQLTVPPLDTSASLSVDIPSLSLYPTIDEWLASLAPPTSSTQTESSHSRKRRSSDGDNCADADSHRPAKRICDDAFVRVTDPVSFLQPDVQTLQAQLQNVDFTLPSNKPLDIQQPIGEFSFESFDYSGYLNSFLSLPVPLVEDAFALADEPVSTTTHPATTAIGTVSGESQNLAPLEIPGNTLPHIDGISHPINPMQPSQPQSQHTSELDRFELKAVVDTTTLESLPSLDLGVSDPFPLTPTETLEHGLWPPSLSFDWDALLNNPIAGDHSDVGNEFSYLPLGIEV